MSSVLISVVASVKYDVKQVFQWDNVVFEWEVVSIVLVSSVLMKFN